MLDLSFFFVLRVGCRAVLELHLFIPGPEVFEQIPSPTLINKQSRASLFKQAGGAGLIGAKRRMRGVFKERQHIFDHVLTGYDAAC